jgi:predicted XRE-type DNA-binding protein
LEGNPECVARRRRAGERTTVQHWGLSQTGAAKVFLITQARISSLLRSNIELFGLDMLVNMLAAGWQVKVTVKKAS